MNDLESALSAIRDAVGPKGWLDGESDLEPYVTEMRGLWRGHCDAVVSPASTAETAAVVTICNGAGIPIVAHGGNTGLVGGGVPDGGIVLSTHRMNAVRQIDPVNFTMTVEAGCILADVQTAAAEADRLFPLSLAAEGSCRIGGNLATNAGGVQVLRYGNARDLVLGLEVVTADGRIWDGLTALRKDNTGYDLKHLFIGSEGTLGIITAAVLKLFPLPKRHDTALAGAASADAMLALFTRINSALGGRLSGFEYINRLSLEAVLNEIPGAVDPFKMAYPAYALIELSSLAEHDGAREALEEILSEALDDEVIIDAVVAQNESQSNKLWHLRESIPEALRLGGASIKHDVAVPVSRVAEFLRRAGKLVETEIPGVRPTAFGHMGDGNIHYNLSPPPDMAEDAFLALWEDINHKVHDLVAEMGGSFSAEHGVGLMKRGELARFKSTTEIDMMRAVKAALDPGNIMNPGKVLPE
mgnify:CR=1 FL=1